MPVHAECGKPRYFFGKFSHLQGKNGDAFSPIVFWGHGGIAGCEEFLANFGASPAIQATFGQKGLLVLGASGKTVSARTCPSRKHILPNQSILLKFGISPID